ncbi:hypothetical protein SODALDRAFT_179409 [Sodiomyces alkalinus F11]|uniref:Uncharacterized protein n=1 Tax=Sodiomyces alkalinus (strain CBS 110278 / VKM F-3762 / F11) TaxID=1314773 RepID=A0A3N2PU51_SODAK|nr:hypothetical protein SODALDRAFT_179409 [Sodiomyces alkalinus F11]ROT38021.1 hypothetical protein SODALDRAFT_179409 [Sodiomyces alkalinus F11]
MNSRHECNGICITLKIKGRGGKNASSDGFFSANDPRLVQPGFRRVRISGINAYLPHRPAHCPATKHALTPVRPPHPHPHPYPHPYPSTPPPPCPTNLVTCSLLLSRTPDVKLSPSPPSCSRIRVHDSQCTHDRRRRRGHASSSILFPRAFVLTFSSDDGQSVSPSSPFTSMLFLSSAH